MKRTAIKVEDTDSFPNGFLVWNVGIIVIIIVIDNEFIFLTLLPVPFFTKLWNFRNISNRG